MNHWNNITPEWLQEESRRHEQYLHDRTARRISRVKRVTAAVLIPIASVGVIAVVLAVVTVVGHRKLEERRQAAELERLQQATAATAEAADTAAEQKLKSSEKVAIDALYEAYYDAEEKDQEKEIAEQEKRRREEEAARAAELAFSEVIDNVMLAEEEVLTALQTKRLADRNLVAALGKRDELASALAQAADAQRNVEEGLVAIETDVATAAQTATALEQQLNLARAQVAEAVQNKERIDATSLGLLENKENLSRDAIRGAIQAAEAAQAAAQAALDEQDKIETALQQARVQHLEAQNAIAALRDSDRAGSDTTTELESRRDDVEKRVQLGNIAKIDADRNLAQAIGDKRRADAAAIKHLNELGYVERADELTSTTAIFGEKISAFMDDLHVFEGKYWLRVAQHRLSEKNFFEAKLAAARAIGYEGFGRTGHMVSGATTTAFPVLLKTAPPEYEEARRILTSEPDFLLIWQTSDVLMEGTQTSVLNTPDGRALIWAENELIHYRSFGHERNQFILDAGTVVSAIAISPNNTSLAAATADNTVSLWDIGSRRVVSQLTGHTGPVQALAFSSTSMAVATGAADHSFRVWRREGQSYNEVFSGTHDGAVTSVAFSPDGEILATAGMDNHVRFWNVSRQEQLLELPGHGQNATYVDFHPNGSIAASAGADGVIRFRNIDTGKEVRSITGLTDAVSAITFSPDGTTLATGDSTSVTLWDVETGSVTARLAGHPAQVFSLDFAMDGMSLVSGGSDGIKLWRTPLDHEQQSFSDRTRIELYDIEKNTLNGHSDAVISIFISHDNTMLFSGSRDKSIRVWGYPAGDYRASINGHSGAVVGLCTDHHNSLLASASLDSMIKLWTMYDFDETKSLKIHNDKVYCIDASPNGKTMASGSKDATIAIWDIGSGTVQRTLSGHDGTVISIDFSPDGDTLVSSDQTGAIKIWDVETGNEIGQLTDHTHAVFNVAFSPDGRYIASCGKDKTVKLWDTANHAPKLSLTGHTETVYSVAFGPDSAMLATASRDKTVRVWNVATGVEIAKFDSGEKAAFSAAFDRRGNGLVSGSGDNTINSWRFQSLGVRNMFAYDAIADTGAYEFDWQPPAPDTPLINISPHSHLAILRTTTDAATIDLQLMRHCFEHRNADGALFFYERLNDDQKASVRPVIAKALKKRIDTALDNTNTRLADWLLRQAETFDVFPRQDPRIYFFKARQAYLDVPGESNLAQNIALRSAAMAKVAEYALAGVTENADITSIDLIKELGMGIIRQIPELWARWKDLPATELLDQARILQQQGSEQAVAMFAVAYDSDESAVAGYLAENGHASLHAGLARYFAGRLPIGGDDGDSAAPDRQRAVDQLLEASKKGWKRWELLQSDPMLKRLRNDPRITAAAAAASTDAANTVAK